MIPYGVALLILTTAGLVGLLTDASAAPAPSYDVVVYGGTSGGVAAAIQVARMGRTVLLVNPGEHLGGLSSSGLGSTDIGNKRAIGGISREFYRRLGAHYGSAEAWNFEPHVAEETFNAMIAEARVPLLSRTRLRQRGGVVREEGRITAILTERGRRITARVFIDATYEGDLMAGAGVSYHVGREANTTYGETLNGVQTAHAVYHQFDCPVSPYVIEGSPESGLLPGIEPFPPAPDGTGDHRVQAYNFRMCLTDDPANRIPFPRPRNYDPLRYELLLRYIKAGHWNALRLTTAMPHRKTDTNNYGGFSTDNIGMNYEYPDADYRTRQRIFNDHRDYQQGLVWFVANDPRVPEPIRAEVSRWGLPKDEFPATGGWPHEMYVREARRMVSDHVMTQHDCQGRGGVEDSVGLAAYTMDSHNVQRYVRDGRVWNEGDVEIGGFSPYPIAYRSIRPRRSECVNLLVPVCLSASHIAYGSIRMEPVFMVLGQSAATAACMAIEERVPVQDVHARRLRERLLQDAQVLDWKP